MDKPDEYQLFSDPWRYYAKMLTDIDSAGEYIYLETFRIMNDVMLLGCRKYPFGFFRQTHGGGRRSPVFQKN